MTPQECLRMAAHWMIASLSEEAMQEVQDKLVELLLFHQKPEAEAAPEP